MKFRYLDYKDYATLVASTEVFTIAGTINKTGEIEFELCQCDVDGIYTATERRFIHVFKEEYTKYSKAADEGNGVLAADESHEILNKIIPISFTDVFDFFSAFKENFNDYLVKSEEDE